MRYVGGKLRIGRQISEILKQHRGKNQLYIEPFVGACGVFQHMNTPKNGSDLDEDIISFLTALKDGWVPPKTISEKQYLHMKNYPYQYPSELRGFVSFGCSFAGKKWGGYARGEHRDYTLEAYKSVMKLQPKIKGAVFECRDYSKLNPENALIYCDPPYRDVTDYPYLGHFNHMRFWRIMRKWSINNIVIISEYVAPDDFLSIWEKKKITTIDQKIKRYNTEKLFIVRAQEAEG